MTAIATVSHTLHLDSLGSVRVHVGRFADNPEVLAACYGEWNAEPRADPVLVRIQSRCVYGEVLGSRDCDCREQLDKAKGLIADKRRRGHLL